MEQEINRKGIRRQHLLFAAAFFPSIMLVKENWLIWLLLEPVGIFITFRFTHRFPSLLMYKKYFWTIQFSGLFFGALVSLIPEHRIFLGLIWFLGCSLPLWPKRLTLGRILSRSKDE